MNNIIAKFFVNRNISVRIYKNLSTTIKYVLTQYGQFSRLFPFIYFKHMK